MTITPEYGEEERMKQQSAGPLQRDSRGVAAGEVEDLEPEDNEAHAPGQVCGRCGTVIIAGQDVRRRPDGHWVHEVCPVDLAGLPAAD
jgi:hypothetical protein